MQFGSYLGTIGIAAILATVMIASSEAVVNLHSYMNNPSVFGVKGLKIRDATPPEDGVSFALGVAPSNNNREVDVRIICGDQTGDSGWYKIYKSLWPTLEHRAYTQRFFAKPHRIIPLEGLQLVKDQLSLLLHPYSKQVCFNGRTLKFSPVRLSKIYDVNLSQAQTYEEKEIAVNAMNKAVLDTVDTLALSSLKKSYHFFLDRAVLTPQQKGYLADTKTELLRNGLWLTMPRRSRSTRQINLALARQSHLVRVHQFGIDHI
ncbi:hypothetical protein BDF22DRAFT_652269 [Syncephalis plumigaleata]|nr:hypothetical protein BDF22DRAFT_652269 [Syncephalis plumigaleata]